MALKLVQATPPAPTPPQAKPATKKVRPFKIPLLTEMTPAEQRDFIYAANDALLNLRLPVGVTVQEGLLHLATRTGDVDYSTPLWQVRSQLEWLRVQLNQPVDIAEDIEAYKAQKRYEPMGPVPVTPSARPIGWVIAYPEDHKAARELIKPILPYCDVLASAPIGQGFPLYHEDFKSQINVSAVLANYRGWWAYSERNRRLAADDRKAVKQLAADSEAAVRARAHAAVLSVEAVRGTTVREALMFLREPLDYEMPDADFQANQDKRWETCNILNAWGISPTYAEDQHAGYVSNVRQLVRHRYYDLQQYRAVLENTPDGGPFKLYV